MSEWLQGWTRVGQAAPAPQLGRRLWEAERELDERKTIDSWDSDENWPSIHKPLFSGPDAKRFDAKLAKIDDLGYGAFGRVEEVVYGSVRLARKRIPRRRGFTIDDLRQESLTMRKLNHRHVVKLVATYAPRSHELCLLIWPAAVCNLSILLEDLEALRLGDGDREDILGRLTALDITDLSSIESDPDNHQGLDCHTKCPLEYLRNVLGCVARAMAHCHANDVRHLDIKPSNILLKADRVYLADFGISRDVSGQDQTTTEGLPGTERWRAPELYADHGSSMQLSDMYSLGLVFLNIATVLYNVRLADFDETLKYPPQQTRDEQLRTRELKLNTHLEKLTSHSLVTPPFMFTYDGQETVRPRPIVKLISRMVAATPRNRLSAEKIDDKLSMLGGIHQIYHGECCKRPISWVEDKWDKKFVALEHLRGENKHQRKRISELEGRDQTYELRLEHERKAFEQVIVGLRSKLNAAEERNSELEAQVNAQHRRPGRDQGRPSNTGATQSANVFPSTPSSVKIPSKVRSLPTTPSARPQISRSSQPNKNQQRRVPNRPSPSPLQQAAVYRSNGDAIPQDAGSSSRSPSSHDVAGYRPRSIGSGSKLPVAVSPSRSGTPNYNREQSMTDSSMASSVFSRHSIETLPTPSHNSPVPGRLSISQDASEAPEWGRLERHDQTAVSKRPSTLTQAPQSSGPSSPTLSASFYVVSSETPSKGGEEVDNTRRKKVPSKSWAEVANEDQRSPRTPKVSTKLRSPLDRQREIPRNP